MPHPSEQAYAQLEADLAETLNKYGINNFGIVAAMPGGSIDGAFMVSYIKAVGLPLSGIGEVEIAASMAGEMLATAVKMVVQHCQLPPEIAVEMLRGMMTGEGDKTSPEAG